MLLLIFFLAVATADVTVVSLPVRGGLSLVLSPGGKADLERLGTVSKVRVEIDRVPPPSSHGPGLNTYIVWTVSPEGIAENIGALEVENGKGRLESTTKFEQFGLIVTAEPHYMVDQPGAAIVFRNQNPRGTDVRRLTVPITVGAYDYSKLQPAQAGLPSLVLQARAAFQIAREAQGERFAESEFRQARVALDTVEDLLTRQVPAEILESSANEAIRRAHLAVVVVRERTLVVALEGARTEAAALGREREQLQGRVQQLSQQLTEQQASADSQNRRTQSELAEANTEKQRLTFELTQSGERLRTVERDLADLQRKQEELQRSLSFELLPEAFDAKKALTPKGRDALIRISGVAGFMPVGQIRIQGTFDEAMENRVRNFLVTAGVSEDRIVLIRK